MTNKILATVLAASIALTSGVTPAVAKPSEGVRLLQGLAALYIISRVIKDNKRHKPVAVAPTLPNRCLKTYHTPRGTKRAFGAHCLRKYAKHVNLPKQCKRRISTDRGRRNIFSRKCLREHGFRVTAY